VLTELKRRYDLIPNLVRTVEGYVAHEREIMDAVTQAHALATGATGGPAAQAQAEEGLTRALRQLFALVENYPQLRAAENFTALQQELANTEDRIQASRRFYNANVRDNNVAIESFPSSIVAGMFSFAHSEFFEADLAVVGEAPQVSFK
jgi:LemA protein